MEAASTGRGLTALSDRSSSKSSTVSSSPVAGHCSTPTPAHGAEQMCQEMCQSKGKRALSRVYVRVFPTINLLVWRQEKAN